MLDRFERTATPWRTGPFRVHQQRLAFGQTYEDPEIELRAFRPHSRVFAIAGAGQTARVLAAAGHYVTAVDISARQIAYAESRVAGEAVGIGTVESILAAARQFAALAGWSRYKVAEFLNLTDCERQVEYWDRRLSTRRWRAAVDALLSRPMLSLCYAGPFAQSVPRDFGKKIQGRLRRCWAKHSNRSNPYAAALLLGTPLPDPGLPASPIKFVCADAASFLENSPTSAFDAFALSNIGDGASLEYMNRLRRAVERAAAPGAVMVWRSFAEPEFDSAANCAELDRSMLWGVVGVRPVAASGEGGQPCFIC